jgi:hypothetical protein
MLLLLALAFQQPSIPQKQLTETFRIAETGTAEPWVMIGGVTRLPSGDLLIPDYRAGTLYRFDASGHPKGQIGRNGDGPGEFRSPTWIGSRGDSIWVYDQMQRRITLLNSQGQHARSLTLRSYGAGATLASDGSILWLSSISFGGPGEEQQPTFIARYSSDGTHSDTLLRVVLGYRPFTVQQGTGSIVGQQRLDDNPLLTLARDGTGWLRVERRTDGPAEFTVTRFGLDGKSRWSRRIPYTPRPVPRAFVDSMVNGWVHPLQAGAPRLPEADVRAALFVPTRFPPVTFAGLGTDGRVWVRREMDANRVTVLDGGTGAPLFEVALPAGSRFAGGDGDRLWAVLKDADDVETLVQYRIQ